MASNNAAFVENVYEYQDRTHTMNSSNLQYDDGIIPAWTQQPAYEQIPQPTPEDVNISYQMTSNQPSPVPQRVVNSVFPTGTAPSLADIGDQMTSRQPSPAFMYAINTAVPAQEDANMSYQIPSIQPSPAPQRFINSAFPTRTAPSHADISDQMTSSQSSPTFLNANNAAAPAQGDANMSYQMPSIQPSPALQRFNNSAFPTGPPPSDAYVSYQISSIQPAPESMINFATSIPPARGDANISYEMTSCQPSPTLLHEINSAATKSPIRGDANICYDMASSLPTPGLYDFQNFVKPTTTAPKRNAGISKDAKQRLNNWYECNKHHPYANAEATRMLARTCNITVVQVRKWFNNKRMRSKRSKTQTALNNEIDCGFITVQIVCK